MKADVRPFTAIRGGKRARPRADRQPSITQKLAQLRRQNQHHFLFISDMIDRLLDDVRQEHGEGA